MTISVATLISLLRVADPVASLAALLLKPHAAWPRCAALADLAHHEMFFNGFNSGFDWLSRRLWRADPADGALLGSCADRLCRDCWR